MRRILTESPPSTGYHHLPSTLFSTESLASRRHSPALGQLLLMLQSAAICVEDRRRHLLRHLTPALQFCVVSSFLPAPLSCLGPLDPSPCSLGLSSHAGSGGCSTCALLCALQGRMSACRTRPAANPGGPQGGAQTGRSPGGGAGGKLTRPGLRNHMLCPRRTVRHAQDPGTGGSVNPK